MVGLYQVISPAHPPPFFIDNFAKWYILVLMDTFYVNAMKRHLGHHSMRNRYLKVPWLILLMTVAMPQRFWQGETGAVWRSPRRVLRFIFFWFRYCNLHLPGSPPTNVEEQSPFSLSGSVNKSLIFPAYGRYLNEYRNLRDEDSKVQLLRHKLILKYLAAPGIKTTPSRRLGSSISKAAVLRGHHDLDTYKPPSSWLKSTFNSSSLVINPTPSYLLKVCKFHEYY